MKSKLEIVKGKEFKISVKDFIEEDDIFIEQYEQAADILDTILTKDRKGNSNYLWQKTEYENNIIAFCGERGDGKSSAMLTFINAIYSGKNNENTNGKYDILNGHNNIKNSYIAEPIVIDPSQFDNVHNILDIVLAKLYKNFNDKYTEDNRRGTEGIVQDLLNQFQKVYRQVAMINNQEKMLDDEFDYEGNIGKLSKLGESTNLKNDFEKLIRQYLMYMKNSDENINNQLLIAVDDLDLCNAAAYKMAEQLRKYMIIPNVVIVMAVKVEQLELAIQEKNISEYKEMLQYNVDADNGMKNELDNEMSNMSERYVSKLIPKARRIYMPKAQMLENVEIVYKDNVDGKIIWKSKTDGIVNSILKLIYEKTGMIFLAEETGMSFLVPNNLRDTINWIVQLGNMEAPIGVEIEKNIDKFYQIFKSDWMNRELSAWWKKWFDTLENMDVIHINTNIKKAIEPLFDWNADTKNIASKMFNWHNGERAVEFFENMYYFELFNDNIFDLDREKIIYGIKTVYTIKLNLMLARKKLFKPGGYINGYIWGNGFCNTIPGVLVKEGDNNKIDRSRFCLRTQIEYNTIVDYYLQIENSLDMESDKISKIPSEDKEKYIKCWLIMGLLVNAYEGGGAFPTIRTMNRTRIIGGNNKLLNLVENSLENYIVGLGDVDVLFDKINLEQIGVKREGKEYKDIIKKINIYNEKIISCAQKITSNIDLAMRLKKYCALNNEYKTGTASNEERSEELVKVFFENVCRFVKQNVDIDVKVDEFRYFEFDIDDKVDIFQLYASLIEKAVEENRRMLDQNVFDRGSKLMQDFKDKLIYESENYVKNFQQVSGFFRSATAEKAKYNLDKMAENIQRYRSIQKKQPEFLDIEKMCKYYEQIVQLYLSNGNKNLSKALHDQYKEFAKYNKFLDIE